MPHVKKPTREQRRIIAANNLDTYSWYVLKNTSTTLTVENVKTGEIKDLPVD